MNARIAAAVVMIASAAVSQTAAISWKSDLELLAKEFPAKHKNAFTVLSREAFEKRVAELGKKIGALDDVDAEGELVSLIAAIGDSHSAVQMRALTTGPRIPLGLYWFKDGLRVVSVPRQNEAAAGKVVTKIGAVSVDEAARRCERLQCFDNESSRRNNVPYLVTFPKVLEFLDIAEDGANVPVTVVDGAGKDATITLAAGSFGRDPVTIKPKKPPFTAPRAKWHDYELLPEGILYIQYNKCATDEAHDLAKFTAELVSLCAKGSVKAIVFDLQYNGGGASLLGNGMFAALSAESPLKDRKNVFCVIGRRTFSSAILNAMTLRKAFGATLVGEPTGGSPNHFGEVTSFELPSSKLKVFYSQKRFEDAPPGTNTIQPDHLAEPTFADYEAGRDVILETIRGLVQK